MFTVKFYDEAMEDFNFEFKNISCLRLRNLNKFENLLTFYLKTFHVYG